MKDSTAMAIAGMACVTATYGVYLTTGAMTDTIAPDGVILSGVIGSVVALATGVAVQARCKKNGG